MFPSTSSNNNNNSMRRLFFSVFRRRYCCYDHLFRPSQCNILACICVYVWVFLLNTRKIYSFSMNHRCIGLPWTLHNKCVAYNPNNNVFFSLLFSVIFGNVILSMLLKAGVYCSSCVRMIRETNAHYNKSISISKNMAKEIEAVYICWHRWWFFILSSSFVAQLLCAYYLFVTICFLTVEIFLPALRTWESS